MLSLPRMVGILFCLCKEDLFCMTNCASRIPLIKRVQDPIIRNAYWIRLPFVTCTKICSSILVFIAKVVASFSIVAFSDALKLFGDDNKGWIIHGVVAAKSDKTNMAPWSTTGLLFPITTMHLVDTAEMKEVKNIKYVIWIAIENSTWQD